MKSRTVLTLSWLGRDGQIPCNCAVALRRSVDSFQKPHTVLKAGHSVSGEAISAVAAAARGTLTPDT